jgi:hypothetical protein
MEPLRPGQAQRSALPIRSIADGALGGAEPTRMYLNFWFPALCRSYNFAVTAVLAPRIPDLR